MADVSDPALRAAFEAETVRLMRQRTAVACRASMCIIPIVVLGDYLFYPASFVGLAVSCILGLLLTGAVLTATSHTSGRARPDRLALFLGVELGATLSGVPVLVLGSATPAAAGFLLIILGVALVIPWRTAQAALLFGALLLMYVGCVLGHGQIESGEPFWTDVSFILTGGVLALLGMRAVAEAHGREFCARGILETSTRRASDLATALEARSVQLQLTNQELEDLLYVASHDLRAPLINVQGFTRELQLGFDALRRELPASPEARAVITDIDESIQFIHTAVVRMDSLIGYLLNLSRIATRTDPVEVVPLAPLVDKIIDSFRYQLDQKRITIALDELPTVIGDPVRLNQAVSNLIDNAIKYMGDRPIRRIEIGARSASGTCTCYVRDTGSGIPKAKHESIFRLFHRAASGVVAGEGIGLTMVRKIIEKHGGRVWVEAAPDEGSTFFFTLRSATANVVEIVS